MKKILMFFSLFVCLFTLASCSAEVSGKTYVYDSFEYKLSDDLTGAEKAVVELAVTGFKKTCEVLVLEFKVDTEGSLWTQDGNKVSYGGVIYTVKGSKLVLTGSKDNYSYTVTYVVKK